MTVNLAVFALHAVLGHVAQASAFACYVTIELARRVEMTREHGSYLS